MAKWTETAGHAAGWDDDWIMPVMLFFIFRSLPSSLVLYYTAPTCSAQPISITRKNVKQRKLFHDLNQKTEPASKQSSLPSASTRSGTGTELQDCEKTLQSLFGLFGGKPWCVQLPAWANVAATSQLRARWASFQPRARPKANPSIWRSKTAGHRTAHQQRLYARALQYFVNRVFETNDIDRIYIDVDGYRERREAQFLGIQPIMKKVREQADPKPRTLEPAGRRMSTVTWSAAPPPHPHHQRGRTETHRHLFRQAKGVGRSR